MTSSSRASRNLQNPSRPIFTSVTRFMALICICPALGSAPPRRSGPSSSSSSSATFPMIHTPPTSPCSSDSSCPPLFRHPASSSFDASDSQRHSADLYWIRPHVQHCPWHGQPFCSPEGPPSCPSGLPAFRLALTSSVYLAPVPACPFTLAVPSSIPRDVSPSSRKL